jgi:SAM-dependent methyltransferase
MGYAIGCLRPGLTVLDLGCGPGTITADLAARVAPGRVLGVDQDPGVVELARQHARTLGVDNVDFQIMDAYQLALEDDAVDLAHAHQLLQHVSDPVAVLREMVRVTRPNGVIAARDGDYAAFTWYPANDGLTEWLRLYRTAARANGGEPDAGRRLLSWAHQAGLTAVTATSSAWTYGGDGARWWGDSWADRILTSSLTHQLTESGLATLDDLRAISQAWRDWSRDPDAWFMVPCGEILAIKQ